MVAVIRALISFLRSAGAASEKDTERDGVLSYAGETHPVAYALGIGFAATCGILELQLLVAAALGAREAGRYRINQRVLREIRSEPQYFLPVLVPAAGAGIAVNLLLHGGAAVVSQGVLL